MDSVLLQANLTLSKKEKEVFIHWFPQLKGTDSSGVKPGLKQCHRIQSFCLSALLSPMC